MFAIRPLAHTDDDFARSASLWNAVWPEHGRRPEDVRYRVEHWNPEQIANLFLLEVGDQTLGQAFLVQDSLPGDPARFYFNIIIHPHHRCRGYGSALFDHLWMTVASHNPVSISADTREDLPDAIRFLEQRGFVQRQRQQQSDLDVTRFDPHPFINAFSRVQDAGWTIKTLREFLESDPDAWPKLYRLHCTLMMDVPWHEPWHPDPEKMWIRRAVKHPNLLPDGFMVLLDGEQPVGVSQLWRDPMDETHLHTGLTGVCAPYRRQGAATALKLRAIDYARQRGVKRITTDNEENNPMYQLNVRLGFQPLPAFIIYRKDL